MSYPESPLVSVICLCYNQARFVEEALQSVMDQIYNPIELIVVDDGSTDDSVNRIEAFRKRHPEILFLNLLSNHGMCAAFNKGLQLAKGEFIIDLAADDVLLPHRVQRQVAVFSELDRTYGVIFTDAILIDENGQRIKQYYKFKKIADIPSGDIYGHILRQHFICSPTMMSRRQVYEDLEGYDQSLCYEDFDFWVRSSRKYNYFFLNEVLTLKRQVRDSDSSQWYRQGHNPHLQSTLMVLQKARALNKTQEEDEALTHSVRYHWRQAIFTENFGLALQYSQLLQQLTPLSLSDQVFLEVTKYHIRLFWAYKLYLRWFFGKNI